MPTTADKLNRSNFGKLLTPIHKKIFFDAYNEKPAQYKEIFKTDTMDRKEFTYPHIGGFGMWASNTEGSTFNRQKMSEGPEATFVAERYDNSYELTWELMQDDLYKVFKGIGKGGSATALGKGLRTTEEVKCADVIKNGFTVNGYDGVPLFSKAHPLVDSTETVSNLIEGELTDATLKEALTLMRKQKDEAGLPIAMHATQLVVCPELEFTAKAIVNSIQQAGTNNNDVNTVPNLKVVVNDYLADETKKIWFIQDTSYENLLFLTREAPIFGSEKIADTMDYRMYGYARWSEGYVDFRGLVGSTGVKA
jgi:phage major head subunit gpT-like protein